MIYFDNAATSLQKPPEVEAAVLSAMKSMGNSGRGGHGAAIEAAATIYTCREKLAELFHSSDAGRIAFTGNATEALNTAILGLLGENDHVITTVLEHNSVLRPLYCLEERGLKLDFVPLKGDKKQGILDYECMEGLLCENTKAIVITHASNLTGNITDLNRVGSFAKKHGLYLIVDASQTAGALPIDVTKDNIDILCFTGHKSLLGPQGTGGIYVREGIDISPLKTGGSGIFSYSRKHPAQMPEALEAGTLNGHGIAGLYASASYLLSTTVETIREKEMELTKLFLEGIRDLPNVKIYGNPNLEKRCAIVSINIDIYDSGQVADALWDEYGIAVRAGAHCAPLAHKAMGTDKQGMVRFSFSCFNTKEEIEQAIQAVREIAG